MKAGLTERMAQGDETALQEVLDQHCRHLCLFVFDRLRNWHDAEEIASEVFWRLWRSARTVREEGLRHWLRRTALNLVIDALRIRYPRERRARMTRLGPEARRTLERRVPDTPRSLVMRPDEEAEIREEQAAAWRRVGQSIQILSPAYRETLLCDMAGYSLQETAEHLGIPVDTVKSRRGYLKVRLRRVMGA
jgi:RNA polymerase sigma-70 factor, ECF subfamily